MDRSPHNSFIKSKTAPKVDWLFYMPGEPARVCKNERGVLIGNTYLADGVEAIKGDWSIWKEAFEYLVPNDEGQMDHLLDVIANTLQRPHQKVRHSILIKGGQRTGKSSIGHAWSAVAGSKQRCEGLEGRTKSLFQGGILQ